MYKKICITNRRIVCDKFHINDYDSEEAFHKLLLQITKVCESGADMIILREKDLDATAYKELAKQAIKICGQHNVRLVLHTFVDEAKQLEYPHIHLPYDLFCEQNAENIRFFETLGVSTHTVEEAIYAGNHGASYVTISPIYETMCKPGVIPKGLDFLEKTTHNTTIPVYALGGINDTRVDACVKHGAAGICMMSQYMQL